MNQMIESYFTILLILIGIGVVLVTITFVSDAIKDARRRPPQRPARPPATLENRLKYPWMY
jgi:hypothetical protein